jgi:hypothetical protein
MGKYQELSLMHYSLLMNDRPGTFLISILVKPQNSSSMAATSPKTLPKQSLSLCPGVHYTDPFLCSLPF